MTDSVMIVRLRLILFWLLATTCVLGAKQLGIKDVGHPLSALVSYDTIHNAFNNESSDVYLAQTHDLHRSADKNHLSNSAEFNKIAAKQSLIPFLAYCVATKNVGRIDDTASAATTVVRRGQQNSFPNPAHPVPRTTPGNIGGRDFSGHAFDRMQERGFTPTVVENAIQSETRTPGAKPNTFQYFDSVNNINVITNSQTGRVITVY